MNNLQKVPVMFQFHICDICTDLERWFQWRWTMNQDSSWFQLDLTAIQFVPQHDPLPSHHSRHSRHTKPPTCHSRSHPGCKSLATAWSGNESAKGPPVWWLQTEISSFQDRTVTRVICRKWTLTALLLGKLHILHSTSSFSPLQMHESFKAQDPDGSQTFTQLVQTLRVHSEVPAWQKSSPLDLHFFHLWIHCIDWTHRYNWPKWNDWTHPSSLDPGNACAVCCSLWWAPVSVDTVPAAGSLASPAASAFPTGGTVASHAIHAEERLWSKSHVQYQDIVGPSLRLHRHSGSQSPASDFASAWPPASFCWPLLLPIWSCLLGCAVVIDRHPGCRNTGVWSGNRPPSKLLQDIPSDYPKKSVGHCSPLHWLEPETVFPLLLFHVQRSRLEPPEFWTHPAEVQSPVSAYFDAIHFPTGCCTRWHESLTCPASGRCSPHLSWPMAKDQSFLHIWSYKSPVLGVSRVYQPGSLVESLLLPCAFANRRKKSAWRSSRGWRNQSKTTSVGTARKLCNSYNPPGKGCWKNCWVEGNKQNPHCGNIQSPLHGNTLSSDFGSQPLVADRDLLRILLWHHQDGDNRSAGRVQCNHILLHAHMLGTRNNSLVDMENVDLDPVHVHSPVSKGNRASHFEGNWGRRHGCNNHSPPVYWVMSLPRHNKVSFLCRAGWVGSAIVRGTTVTRLATAVTANRGSSGTATEFAENPSSCGHILPLAGITSSFIRQWHVIFFAAGRQIGWIRTPTTWETHLPCWRALQIGANLRVFGVGNSRTRLKMIKMIAVDGRSTTQTPNGRHWSRHAGPASHWWAGGGRWARTKKMQTSHISTFQSTVFPLQTPIQTSNESFSSVHSQIISRQTESPKTGQQPSFDDQLSFQDPIDGGKRTI